MQGCVPSCGEFLTAGRATSIVEQLLTVFTMTIIKLVCWFGINHSQKLHDFVVWPDQLLNNLIIGLAVKNKQF